jgi:hypothetical protein
MKHSPFPSHHVPNVLCVDEERVDRDINYRFHFLAQFFDFTEDDIKIIHENLDFVKTITPKVITGSQTKILAFDATRKLMLGRLVGYEGDMFTDPDDITLDSPNVMERHKIFCSVFDNLFASNWDEAYLNGPFAIGLSYKWGNKYIDIPVFANTAAFMCGQFLYTDYTMKSDLPLEVKIKLSSALSKALGIVAELTTTALLNDIDLPEVPEEPKKEIPSGTNGNDIEYLY